MQILQVNEFSNLKMQDKTSLMLVDGQNIQPSVSIVDQRNKLN